MDNPYPTTIHLPTPLITRLDKEAKRARKELMNLPPLSWLVRAAKIGSTDPRWGNKGSFSALLFNFVESKLLTEMQSSLSSNKMACSALIQNGLMIENGTLALAPRSKSTILGPSPIAHAKPSAQAST